MHGQRCLLSPEYHFHFHSMVYDSQVRNLMRQMLLYAFVSSSRYALLTDLLHLIAFRFLPMDVPQVELAGTERGFAVHLVWNVHGQKSEGNQVDQIR